MSFTTETILYYNDGSFYKQTGGSLAMLDDEALKRLNQYSIIIDDSMFFYETINIVIPNKRKINDIVKNYLLVSYPESMIQNFKIIHLKESLLIAIPSEQLLQAIEYNFDIFKKAKKTSSLFIEIATENDTFIYKTDKSNLMMKNSMIEYDIDESIELKMYSNDTALLSINVLKNDLKLAEKHNGIKLLSTFKAPAAVLLITYLLFFAGEVFRIQKIYAENSLVTSHLNQQYIKAGVADKSDPYGLLLFKAKKGQASNKIKITQLIEKLGKAKGGAQINSLNYKNGFLRFDGNISDFTVLEQFKESLQNNFGTKVVVTDTKRVDSLVHFSIRIKL